MRIGWFLEQEGRGWMIFLTGGNEGSEGRGWMVFGTGDKEGEGVGPGWFSTQRRRGAEVAESRRGTERIGFWELGGRRSVFEQKGAKFAKDGVGCFFKQEVRRGRSLTGVVWLWFLSFWFLSFLWSGGCCSRWVDLALKPEEPSGTESSLTRMT